MYKLRDQIERVREEMLKIAFTEGFNSPEAIKKSKELDELILRYQQMNQNESVEVRIC
ncbi:Spo0E family sporulation regulatory protein-aspartic acid phosphatase [Niallia sp. HCP3S3_B10]|jgi:Spo0E like sporulation regulatory protein|uniref:aspartyl-phosphate phosphatase Spo0E family protein n=1 Tax=Niallia TaxID=2837506 RepID=UPI0009E3BA98|nr:aspartyl-phosphate phosphatase Spo0E family protein [Niallia circulans]QJX65149.1 aspartyl-phosphate phosphatase Spo0E family protein [Niallia circulans]